jgi:hypothetical protein
MVSPNSSLGSVARLLRSGVVIQDTCWRWPRASQSSPAVGAAPSTAATSQTGNDRRRTTSTVTRCATSSTSATALNSPASATASAYGATNHRHRPRSSAATSRYVASVAKHTTNA